MKKLLLILSMVCFLITLIISYCCSFGTGLIMTLVLGILIGIDIYLIKNNPRLWVSITMFVLSLLFLFVKSTILGKQNVTNLTASTEFTQFDSEEITEIEPLVDIGEEDSEVEFNEEDDEEILEPELEEDVEEIENSVKEVPTENVVVKEVPTEKVVVKEVPTEKVIVKEVVKEVPTEKVIVKEVVKEVPVEKEVVKEVVKEVPKVVEKEKEKEVSAEENKPETNTQSSTQTQNTTPTPAPSTTTTPNINTGSVSYGGPTTVYGYGYNGYGNNYYGDLTGGYNNYYSNSVKISGKTNVTAGESYTYTISGVNSISRNKLDIPANVSIEKISGNKVTLYFDEEWTGSYSIGYGTAVINVKVSEA